MTTRHYILIAALWLASAGASAQSVWNARYQQYIDQYRDCAIEQMLKWKIPASITLAQGVLESGAGQSELARRGNNHFGIKCHTSWTGPTVHRDDDARNECFRAYSSAFESFEDHSRFLATGQRYRQLFRLKLTDYQGWAHGLKAAGWPAMNNYPGIKNGFADLPIPLLSRIPVLSDPALPPFFGILKLTQVRMKPG